MATLKPPFTRSRKARTLPLVGLLLTVVGTGVIGCQQPQVAGGLADSTAAKPERVPEVASEVRLEPIDARFARDIARLDQLCWSITLEINLEMPSDNVHLLVRYETGDVSGAGKEFTARTGREAVSAAIRAVEGEAHARSDFSVSEAELLELSDLFVEVKRRCWFLRMEKSSDAWTVVAKELRAGTRASMTAMASGSDLKAALADVLKGLDRAAAAPPG